MGDQIHLTRRAFSITYLCPRIESPRHFDVLAVNRQKCVPGNFLRVADHPDRAEGHLLGARWTRNKLAQIMIVARIDLRTWSAEEDGSLAHGRNCWCRHPSVTCEALLEDVGLQGKHSVGWQV
jgi:hypothetical protein